MEKITHTLLIFAMVMLSACGGRQTQTENAKAAANEPTEVKVQQHGCTLTGTIGEDNASMVLEKNGGEVTGAVTRCDACVPIDVKGTWRGNFIEVEGFSMAGSHIKYKLTVTGNAVQGLETLSAEGEVEEQDVSMTIE